MTNDHRVIYPTKIGGFMYIIMLLFGAFTLIGILSQEWFIGAIFATLSMLFVWICYGTHYWIENDQFLVIKAPLYGRKKLPIERITKVYLSGNPLNSPAPSLDRMAIHYDISGFLLISPVNRDQLIQDLIRINPSIQSLSER